MANVREDKWSSKDEIGAFNRRGWHEVISDRGGYSENAFLLQWTDNIEDLKFRVPGIAETPNIYDKDKDEKFSMNMTEGFGGLTFTIRQLNLFAIHNSCWEFLEAIGY